jgi:hypothetical protein
MPTFSACKLKDTADRCRPMLLASHVVIPIIIFYFYLFTFYFLR